MTWSPVSNCVYICGRTTRLSTSSTASTRPRRAQQQRHRRHRNDQRNIHRMPHISIRPTANHTMPAVGLDTDVAGKEGVGAEAPKDQTASEKYNRSARGLREYRHMRPAKPPRIERGADHGEKGGQAPDRPDYSG